MKQINSKEELKSALKKGEKQFIITDKKLLKALAVKYWIQKNKVKGALLMAALPAAIAVGTISAPIAGIVGAGITIGGTSGIVISATEIVIIGGLIISLTAIIRGQKIKEIDFKDGRIYFE